MFQLAAFALLGCSAPDVAPSLVPVDANFPATLEGGSVDAAAGQDVEASPPGRDAGAADSATRSRFVTQVIDFQEGTCAGFNANDVSVVFGPPQGAGSNSGSEDVLSLGNGGSVIVGFGENAIANGPGIDFVVFENPFFVGGNSAVRFAEPGEVAVSNDGINWVAFPCTDTTQEEPDGGWGATQCAGINPVFSNSKTQVDPISPFDLERAGGDQYDLDKVGVAQAKYVRIRNIVTSESCAEQAPKYGFDLDAIAIIHPAIP